MTSGERHVRPGQDAHDEISAVVLGGGLGTRLRAAVPDLPKPMALVDGRPFLEYLLEHWVEQGIGHFLLSVGYRHESIVAYFGARFNGASIEYVIESQPLGTGGAMLLAQSSLSRVKPFLLLNGDTFFNVGLKPFREAHAAARSDLTISMVRVAHNDRYTPLEVRPDGRILALRAPAATGSTLINGGVYLIEPAVLATAGWKVGQKASLENEILPGMLRAGVRVFGYEGGDKFIDIGIPDDYARAAALLTAR
jgi:D-glycero-alpha-D-manno-heptose 1-phosphate guanylyltransferase